jgi:IS30 family transposase
MEVKKHRRLTLKERIIIQTLLREKKSKSYIAIRLG